MRAELADTFATTADLAGDRLIEELRRDQLDAGTLRALATVAGISADKLVILGDRLTATDDHGNSLLDRLAAGFQSWAENTSNTEPNTETPEDRT